MPRPLRPVQVFAAALVMAVAGTAAVAPARPAAAADPAPAAIAATHQVVVTWTAADLGAATRAGRQRALRDPDRVDRLARAAGTPATFVRVFGTRGTTGVYRLEERLGRSGEATLARLRGVRGVASVEADPIAIVDAGPITTVDAAGNPGHALPSDPYASLQWGMLGPSHDEPYGMDALGAFGTSTGEDTVVAVIDTGIRPHADLVPNLVPGYDLVSDATVANDGDGRDADPSDPGDWCGTGTSSWHGTFVAGIVGAVLDNGAGVFGAAPSAKVQPVRVLGRCGGTFTDIADGITWASGGAVPGVPANPTPAVAANVSIGAQVACPQFMVDAIAGARARGTLTVVSAGNRGVDAATQAPASCPGVVTVAATDADGTRASFGTTSSSNYGAVVEVAAPGAAIPSTHNAGTTVPGDDRIGSGSGTSFAAPHVAALAALLRASRPAAQPAAIQRAIEEAAAPFAPDASPLGCPTAGCGAGIANAPAALAFLATADIAPPAATVTPPASPTAAASLAFGLAFDEPVTGLVAADLGRAGTAKGCVVGTPAGAGTTWTVPVTGCGDGTVSLTLAARGVEDAVGNVGPEDAASGGPVLVDRSAPTSAGSVTTSVTTGTIDVAYTASDGAGAGLATVTAFVSPASSLASPQACGTTDAPEPAGTIQCMLPAADAVYRVFTRATDAVGNAEPVPGAADDTVIRDTTAPAVSAPGVTPRTSVPLSGSAIPVTVTWRGADGTTGSGIAAYALERSLDGGVTWSTVASGVTGTSRTSSVPASGSTRFRVRATDAAGNEGVSTATTRAGRLVQQSSSAVRYPTAWTSVSGSSYSGGSARYTRTAGRSASYTFTARSIAVVSTRASTRGKVRIYVSGVLQATVDTVRSSTQYRSVIWQKTYTTTQTRTIRLVVVGTSGRPRVDLDAFVVLR